MTSAIDATKPVTGNPTTQSVRDNFAAAKTEIEALQALVTAQAAAITALQPISYSGSFDVQFGGVTTDGTFSTNHYEIIRNGKVCFITGRIVFTNKGTKTGAIKLGGLPVTVQNRSSNSCVMNTTVNSMTASVGDQFYANAPQNTDGLTMLKVNAGVAAGVTDTSIGNSSVINVSGVFECQ